MTDKTVAFKSRSRNAGFTAFDNPVLRSKRLSPGAKIVWGLLCFYAREDEKAWPGQDTLAEHVPCSERAVRGYVAELRAVGLVEVVRRGLGRTNLYRLGDLDSLSPDERPAESAARSGEQRRSGAEDTAATDRQNLPVPMLNNTEETKTQRPRRRGESPPPRPSAVTYRGRRVPSKVVEDAERLVGVFAEATGRSHPARTGDGRPTAALKQVCGALLARPEVSVAEWERAVRNTVACPPGWVDGPLLLGHVFGERAADHALANPGKRGSGAVQTPGASVQSGVERDWNAEFGVA